MTGAKLMSARTGNTSLVAGDIAIHSVSQPVLKAHSHTKNSLPQPVRDTFVLTPTALTLGGKTPATLEGRFDATGYTLHLSGMASSSRLSALETALPDLGDGLAKAVPVNHGAAPSPIDLTAVRPWSGAQVWTATSSHPVVRHARRARRQ